MTYRAGIIGAGGIAGLGILGMHDKEDIGKKKFEASHAGGYNATDGIELVAVSDIDESKLERFGSAWDLPDAGLYTNYETMLESESLDVVSVCTPSFLHADHVVAAAEIGDPAVILCEKPIASSVRGAERMCEICEKQDVELVINHSFRFTEKLQRLRDLIVDEDLIGDIRSISTQFRRELVRNSTHIIDTMIYLLDTTPKLVSGFVNEENDAVDALEGESVDDAGGGGMIVMEDDTFATVDCTVAREISSMLFSFIGTEGKLYLNNDDGEWRYWSLADGSHVEESLPGIEGAWSWDEDYQRAFPNVVEHVVSLADGEVTNHSPGTEATRSIEVIVGFYIAHLTQSQVTLPLDDPLKDVSITSW